jgi:hypothetical protein
VERAFGVLKNRFPVLKYGCKYSIETQVKLIYALCVIHNFIIEKKTNGEVDIEQRVDDELPQDAEDVGAVQGADTEANEYRDRIAQAMWADYSYRIAQRAK